MTQPVPPSSPVPSTHGTPPTPSSDWSAARGEKWCAQLSGMEATLAPIDAPLIHALKLDAPYRIAEIGCGGGGTALEIVRQAQVGTVVHGFDISPALIETARQRAHPLDPVLVFETRDMATAQPDEPYHRLVSRFGVMFFDQPASAFANLLHWLMPGGRFAFAVWGHPAENPWLTSVHDVVARIIDIPSADPDAPGPFRYAHANTLFSLLERAGFAEINVRDVRTRLPIGDTLGAEAAATFALTAFASFGELLAKAGDGAFEAAQQALTTRFSEQLEDGKVRMDACIHLVTGTRARAAE